MTMVLEARPSVPTGRVYIKVYIHIHSEAPSRCRSWIPKCASIYVYVYIKNPTLSGSSSGTGYFIYIYIYILCLTDVYMCICACVCNIYYVHTCTSVLCVVCCVYVCMCVLVRAHTPARPKPQSSRNITRTALIDCSKVSNFFFFSMYMT